LRSVGRDKEFLDVLVDEDVDEWLSGPWRWSLWINKVGRGRLQQLIRKDTREELHLCCKQKLEFDCNLRIVFIERHVMNMNGFYSSDGQTANCRTRSAS